MIDVKLIDGLLDFAGEEGDEQRQGIAVTALRIPRQIALAYQMLEEKAPHPRTEPGCVSHGAPPAGHTAQSAPRRRAATPGSSSGRLESRRYSRAPSRWPGGAAVVARRHPAGTRTSPCGQQNCASNSAGGINAIVPAVGLFRQRRLTQAFPGDRAIADTSVAA